MALNVLVYSAAFVLQENLRDILAGASNDRTKKNFPFSEHNLEVSFSEHNLEVGFSEHNLEVGFSEHNLEVGFSLLS